MNPWTGWTLAAAALVAGWYWQGWRGVALAFSVVVFWLLLQFSRSLRVLRDAGGSPMGRVDSAVMFNARLRARMQMLEVVKLARSLGRRIGETPEVWQWADDGGSRVLVTFVGGRCTQWTLQRPADQSDAVPAALPASPSPSPEAAAPAASPPSSSSSSTDTP